MTRLLALTAVLFCVFAATASARSSAGDPRVCQYMPAARCAKRAAITALRQAMSKRLGIQGFHGMGWDANITCIGSVGFLRFRCSWTSPPYGPGWAVVTFAPMTFRPAVVVKALVCADPTHKGCSP